MLSPSATDYITKNYSGKYANFSFKVLPGKRQRDFPKSNTIAIAWGCHPEPEGKSLLLKALHSVDRRLGRLELGVTSLIDSVSQYWKI